MCIYLYSIHLIFIKMSHYEIILKSSVLPKCFLLLITAYLKSGRTNFSQICYNFSNTVRLFYRLRGSKQSQHITLQRKNPSTSNAVFGSIVRGALGCDALDD